MFNLGGGRLASFIGRFRAFGVNSSANTGDDDHHQGQRPEKKRDMPQYSIYGFAGLLPRYYGGHPQMRGSLSPFQINIVQYQKKRQQLKPQQSWIFKKHGLYLLFPVQRLRYRCILPLPR